MASIRISDDIQAIAQQVSTEKGLNSTRVAIEAIVRCYWKEYLEGRCPASSPITIPTAVQPIEEIDAIAALDSVL